MDAASLRSAIVDWHCRARGNIEPLRHRDLVSQSPFTCRGMLQGGHVRTLAAAVFTVTTAISASSIAPVLTHCTAPPSDPFGKLPYVPPP